MTEMNLKYKTSPVFLANYLAFHENGVKIICNQGGTRSGKTYSITQLLILLATTTPKLRVSIVSKTFPHLKRGVLRDFTTIMQDLGIFEDERMNRSEYIYKFPNGSFIEFFSADTSEKLRGPGRDILFINEANLLSYDEFLQLLLRTTKKVFIDYNPVDEYCWIYDYVLIRPDTKFIQSCYLDNYEFLPKTQIEEIERLKDIDPHQWQIFGLGNIAKATNLIYPNFKISQFDVNTEPIYGLDFGFNNPTALVQVQQEGGTLYCKQLLYETNLTNADLIARLNELIQRRTNFIYADAAEPARIEEIKRAGFNIWPADKNVKQGVDFIKRFQIVISPDSVDLQKEIKSYKWKTDKDDKILDDPIKINDHALDAMRYAAYTYGSKYWTQDNSVQIPLLHKFVKPQKSKIYDNY